MKLIQFINNFNFAEPKFDDLPEDFPRITGKVKKGLTISEQRLLDAIVISWIMSGNNIFSLMGNYIESDPVLYSLTRSQLIKRGTMVVLFLITGLALISSLYYMNVQYHLGMKFLTDIFA